MSAPHHLSAAWRDADALRTQGQLAAARDLLEPVADIAAIRLGADHPDVIETMRRLAGVHRDLGELASARRVLEEAMEGARVRYAEDHAVVLGISGELGSLADELGNRHEARRNFTRLAQFGPAVLGAQHPYVRAAQRFLGTDAPVPEPAPEAQAGFAPARGYDAPPPGFGPPPPTTAATPTTTAPPAPLFPLAPTREDEALTPDRATDPDQASLTQGNAPPPVQEEPGVYRPAERIGHVEYSTHPAVNPFASPPVPTPTVPARPTVGPPAGAARDGDRHRSRLPLVALAIVAVAALAAGAVMVAVTLLRPHSPGPSQAGQTPTGSVAPTPTAGASAPTGLFLRDDGNTVTLTWKDPSAGIVPFFVEVGPAGGQLRIYGRLNPGETTYPVVGLNPRSDYCFSVVAVYSTTLMAPSDLVCTQRAGKASPSR